MTPTKRAKLLAQSNALRGATPNNSPRGATPNNPPPGDDTTMAQAMLFVLVVMVIGFIAGGLLGHMKNAGVL